MRPPALVSWKQPIERRLLDAAGTRGAVIVSSAVYGDAAATSPASCSLHPATPQAT